MNHFDLLVIALISAAGLFGYSIYYAIDNAIDYSILHNEIITNQTFVDEMSCEKIIITRNTLSYVNSPNQQEEVEQLKIDFDKLYKEKGCK